MQAIIAQQRLLNTRQQQACAHRRIAACHAAPRQVAPRQIVCAALPQGARQAASTGLALLAALQLAVPAPTLAFGTPDLPSPSDVSKAVDRNTPDLPSPSDIQKKVKQEGNAAGGAPSLDTKGTKDQVKDAVGSAKSNVVDAGKTALNNATPKKGLFEKINEQALTDQSPSKQYRGQPINTPSGR